MEKVTLNAEKRTVTGKKVGMLRREGKLPAVMYGHNFEPTAITLDLRETTRALQGQTSSTLITIALEGKEHATLVREKQRDYILGTLKHIDFQVVSLTEKIRAMVSVVTEGVSPAVKDFNGVVVTGLSEIEVEGLPQDLPQVIRVDLSTLHQIGDACHVRDIDLPANITVLSDLDEMLVLVTGGTTEEELEEAETVATAAEPEVIEKGKKEEEVEE